MKTPRPRMAIAMTAVAAVALIGGCSSSSDKESSSTTTAAPATTTKAEFVTAAEAICQKANEQMNAITFSSNESLEASVPGLEEQAQILGNVIDQIRALPQPSGAADPSELYTTITDVQSGMNELIEAAKANDQAEAEKMFDQLNEETDAANQVWDAYGLPDCGSSSTSGSTTTTAG